MGVNTGMIYDDGDSGLFLDNHFPYYVENMVNRGLCLKWNSNVRDREAFVTRWTRLTAPNRRWSGITVWTIPNGRIGPDRRC